MSSSVLGNAVARREDPRLIQGEGAFVGDMSPDGTLHAVFVRSDVPHGRVTALDVDAAHAVPGVVEVVTPADLDIEPLVIWGSPPECARSGLTTTARYVGDPIALIVATSERAAADAASMCFADIDPLPVVVDPEAALEPDAPQLFDDLSGNLALQERAGWEGDPLEDADVIIEARLVNQRLAPVPMEASGCLAIPESGGTLTVYLSTQDVFNTRNDLADMLRMPAEDVRVIAPDVGGGFGAKGDLMVEHGVIADAARRLGKPVRWIERRTENLTNMVHGRAQVQHLRLGATREGRLVGVQLDVIADLGAYPGVATWLPRYTLEMTCGCYDIDRASASFSSVVTNTTPTGAYRGAGRPEAIQALERGMDLLAAKLGVDPVEIRRRNLLPRFDTPHTTAIGTVYDSGDYTTVLDRALEISDHASWVARRDARRQADDRLQLGVGVACYVEVTVGKTPPKEFGGVEVRPDGRIVARAGGANQGQGHATAFAQIVSAVFDLPMDRIEVIQGDTGQIRTGGGTFASRTLQLAGTSLHAAATSVIETARKLAADELEASIDDIRLLPGLGMGVAGSPDSVIGWGDLAVRGNARGTPLSAEEMVTQPASTFPFGTHVAIVELDTETGWVRLVEHTAVDDCGNRINPMLVMGQQHGGVAQGAGQALFEHARFDDAGNPLTGNLVTYQIPAATDLPSFRVASHETPTPHNILGAKGVGEAGTLGSTPAIHSAVMDVLAPFGVRHLDMPLRPERIWRAMRGLEEERTRP